MDAAPGNVAAAVPANIAADTGPDDFSDAEEYADCLQDEDEFCVESDYEMDNDNADQEEENEPGSTRTDALDDEQSSEFGDVGTVDFSNRLWIRVYKPESDDASFIPAFSEIPGNRNLPRGDLTEVDYFNLFVTDELCTKISEESQSYYEQNKEAYKQKVEADPTKASTYYEKMCKWFDETRGFCVRRIRLLLGIILAMCLCVKRTESKYWAKPNAKRKRQTDDCDTLLETPGFGRIISRDRFRFMKRYLHFVDNSTLPNRTHEDYDPIGRIRPILDYFNWKFSHHYMPGPRITIDESLVGMKNRNPIMQYIANKKHHRWGAKLYVLAEVGTGYTYRMRVHNKVDQEKYTEMPPRISIAESDSITKNLTNVDRLVLHLMDGTETEQSLLAKGYNLYTDNYYTSVPLAVCLQELETTLTGTVRRNRKFLPQSAKKQLAVGEDFHVRKDTVLVCAFREKKSQNKPVLLLSTTSVAKDVEITRDSGKKVTVPEIISHYVIGMRGADQADQMVYQYSDERRGYRWYRKLFFNFIHRALLNAYIVYYRQKITDGKPFAEREEFIERVIGGLINGNRETGFMAPQSRSSASAQDTPPASPSTSSPSPVPTSRRKHNIQKLEVGTSKNGKRMKRERDCYHCSKRQANRKRKRTTYECTICNKGVCKDCFNIHENSKPVNY